MSAVGPCDNRPWPPTSSETAHDPKCLHDAPGPGGYVCDLGCEGYIEQVEAYWEGRADLTKEVIDYWNRMRGWIPGANYAEFAKVLDADPERLWHWDIERKAHVVEGVLVSTWPTQ